MDEKNLNDLTETVKNIGEDLKDKAGDILSNPSEALGKLGGAFEGVKNKVEKIIPENVDLGKAVESVKDKVEEIIPDNVDLGKAVESAKSLGGGLLDKAKDFLESEEVKNTIDSVKEKFGK